LKARSHGVRLLAESIFHLASKNLYQLCEPPTLASERTHEERDDELIRNRFVAKPRLTTTQNGVVCGFRQPTHFSQPGKARMSLLLKIENLHVADVS
jgi:hypothetical protein